MNILMHLLSWQNKKTKNSGVLCKAPTVEDNKMNEKLEITETVVSGMEAVEQAEAVVSDEVEEPEKEKVPEGRYTALISDAKQFPHSKGYDVIALWLELEGGKYSGEMIPKYYNLNTIKSKQLFLSDMKKFGLSPVTRTEMLDCPSKLNGKKVDINLAYNQQGYPVAYILKHLQVGLVQFDPNSLWQ